MPYNQDTVYIIYINGTQALITATKSGDLIAVNIEGLSETIEKSHEAYYEVYSLNSYQYDVDREVIESRAAVQGLSRGYMISMSVTELMNALTSQRHSGRAPPVAEDTDRTRSSETISVDEELSEMLKDPVFLSRLMIGNKSYAVYRTPSKTLFKELMKLVKNARNMAIHARTSRLDVWLLVKEGQRLGIMIRDDNIVTGRDALELLSNEGSKAEESRSNDRALIMAYLLPEDLSV